MNDARAVDLGPPMAPVIAATEADPEDVGRKHVLQLSVMTVITFVKIVGGGGGSLVESIGGRGGRGTFLIHEPIAQRVLSKDSIGTDGKLLEQEAIRDLFSLEKAATSSSSGPKLVGREMLSKQWREKGGLYRKTPHFLVQPLPRRPLESPCICSCFEHFYVRRRAANRRCMT